MAGTHLFQHLVAFALALWWTSKWLVSRPVSRWRFAVSALAGGILWIYVAYTALGSEAASNGTVISYQSEALAYFAAFMAFVSVIGIVLGLLLWTEEEGKNAAEGLPDYLRSEIRGD